MRLSDRVAIVIGVESGIGRDIALHVEKGADLIIPDLNKSKRKQLLLLWGKEVSIGVI
jgi:NAD(P)-dependent dehydrogenase (short-subunit alcohol dehydrogenase family)